MSKHQYTQNRLTELRTEFASLKTQSNDCFAFASQARSALPDISDLRITVKDSLQSQVNSFALLDILNAE
jgi:type II secretory pathway component PulM